MPHRVSPDALQDVMHTSARAHDYYMIIQLQLHTLVGLGDQVHVKLIYYFLLYRFLLPQKQLILRVREKVTIFRLSHTLPRH
jgi:hypothetical protein